jgi:hypothetical protein
MKWHTPLLLGLCALSLSAAGVALGAADAGAAASAAPKASARARPPTPVPLASQEIPTAASDNPTLDEWKSAQALEVTRRSPEAISCRAYRVREWLKVHCDFPMAGIRQLGGSADGVLLWVVPKTNETLWEGGQGGQVILPLRAGDRRVIQFFALEGGDYGGIWSAPSVVLDEVWLEGAARPTVILR